MRALFALTPFDGKERHKVSTHFDRSLSSRPYTLKNRDSISGGATLSPECSQEHLELGKKKIY